MKFCALFKFHVAGMLRIEGTSIVNEPNKGEIVHTFKIHFSHWRQKIVRVNFATGFSHGVIFY